MEDRLIQLAQRAGLLHTPAFILDERELDLFTGLARQITPESRTRLFLGMDPYPLLSGLEKVAASVDGLCAKSLPEARFARQMLGDGGQIHVTKPGLRSDELHSLSELTDYVSFTSFAQWETHGKQIHSQVSCGLRINPQLPVHRGACRSLPACTTTLGVPLERLSDILRESPSSLSGLDGIHIESRHNSNGIDTIIETVYRLEARVRPLLEHIEWIILGGDYRFDEVTDPTPIRAVIHHLRSHYDADIIFQPSTLISRRAGYFVSQITELFETDGKHVAVLDTSVNHVPEVFEYHFAPEVSGANNHGAYRYILAGATCLPGDLLGEYAFESPLELGQHLVFSKAAAYAMAKASIFTGISLPAIYLLSTGGDLELKKVFTYNDYLSLCGKT